MHDLPPSLLQPSSRMLRLLGIKSSKTHTAEDELMDLQVGVVWCVCKGGEGVMVCTGRGPRVCSDICVLRIGE